MTASLALEKKERVDACNLLQYKKLEVQRLEEDKLNYKSQLDAKVCEIQTKLLQKDQQISKIESKLSAATDENLAQTRKLTTQEAEIEKLLE